MLLRSHLSEFSKLLLNNVVLIVTPLLLHFFHQFYHRGVVLLFHFDPELGILGLEVRVVVRFGIGLLRGHCRR